MSTAQCPRCFYHADHIYTFEGGKNGLQWVIERCPNCLYAGWSNNPLKYNEYLKMRREQELTAKHFFDDETGELR